MTDKQLLEKLVKGQEDIKTVQQAQGKIISNIKNTLDEHGKTLNEHGKALKKLTTLANKTHKSVNLMAGKFDEQLVDHAKRIGFIEENLNLTTLKS